MYLLKVKPIVITLLLLFCMLHSSAQNQNNVWCFGGFAGLNFNLQPVDVLNDSKMNTDEACASIADDVGDLLFYTNGQTVWNKQHNIMNNGTGLSGHQSATQTVIIPAPGNDQLFYLFTAGIHGAEHLDYSVIDMTADGGLGSVTIKNTRLLNSLVSEKMVAVKHSNGDDIWLIGHATLSNEFYAWLVTKNGVSPPVTSFAGTALTGVAIDLTAGIGYLKASRDGKTLALTGEHTTGAFVELLNFNIGNGNVTATGQKVTGFKPNFIPYGVEFSTSGNLLYATEYKAGEEGNLYQIKIPFASADLATSATILASLKSEGALQWAPDGKIYFSQSDAPYLHTINFPDLEGAACGFQVNAVRLNGNKATLGLPPANLTKFTGLGFIATGKCSSTITQFKLRTSIENLTNITWDFGDPASGANNASTNRDPSHKFTRVGTYTIILSALSAGNLTQYHEDIVISETPAGAIHDISENVILCDPGKATLKAQGATGTLNYNWYNAAKTLLKKTTNGSYQTDALSASATYYVALANEYCEGELKKIEVIYDKPRAEITASAILVDVGGSVTLEANDAIKYEWTPAADLSSSDAKTTIATPQKNTTYTLKVTNANGCTDIATVSIKLSSRLVIPNTFTPNGDGINDFWVIKNIDFQDNTLQVFNRYGKMVYNIRNYTNTWNGTYNGKQLPAGVYYYVINLYNQFISGSVTILR